MNASALARALDECRRVSLDTNALLYFFRGNSERAEVVSMILDYAFRGRLQVIVPGVAQVESLVGPLKSGSLVDIRKVMALTEGARGVMTVQADREMMFIGAEVRARTRLRLPDALVVATAMAERCDVLIGNDRAMEGIEALAGISSLLVQMPRQRLRFLRIDEFLG